MSKWERLKWWNYNCFDQPLSEAERIRSANQRGVPKKTWCVNIKVSFATCKFILEYPCLVRRRRSKKRILSLTKAFFFSSGFFWANSPGVCCEATAAVLQLCQQLLIPFLPALSVCRRQTPLQTRLLRVLQKHTMIQRVATLPSEMKICTEIMCMFFKLVKINIFKIC